jgi:hypothetical protein
MKQTCRTFTLLLSLCILTGCLSLHVRSDDPFSSRGYIPPWKWIQIDRSKPEPKRPHLSLSVDRNFFILSHIRDLSPEQQDRSVAKLIAPYLRQIESELNGSKFRAICSGGHGLKVPGEQWPIYEISDDMQYLLWGRTEDSGDMSTLSHRAYWYACVRLAGFSASYAMRSQAEGFAPPPGKLPKEARVVLRNHPHVPPNLLRTHKWTCDSGHEHKEFYVIDNGIAWVLQPDEADLGDAGLVWFYPDRRDAQEFDPALSETFTSARLKAESILKEKEITGMGSCHAFWSELREILKDEYDIEWRSPSELNPNTMYD